MAEPAKKNEPTRKTELVKKTEPVKKIGRVVKTGRAKQAARRPRLVPKPAARAAAPTRRARARPAFDLLEVLRERIARQEVPPGATLREHELALEFGVPRTRVR